MRISVALAGVAVLLPALGCSNDSLTYAPAAGRITLDGQPLDRAEISLIHADGQPAGAPQAAARGVTDATGAFTLKTLTPNKELVPGAPVGNHRVAIRTELVEQDASGAQRVVRRELLPERYTGGGELTADIPSDGNENLLFELKSK